ncbi:uncharacterized mitochondrial protein AtMg00810-like [Lathyrus oleraceus]|uniref:uncharacterized mitochondrial protein AtMg00810-like n=1 Tax=Pisum sativum TaxID=3888 RepID=UPI0021D2B8A8|nr:uncharacterized mitochondrial protein AtMg00810-like [Pisum sativum]
MAELNYFPSLQIKQLNEGTFVCQIKYCNELVKRFGMEDEKSIDTLIPTNGNSEKDENAKEVDVNKYRGMIGSLLYLIVSRSDIVFSMCMCSHYQSAPKISHLKAVKQVLIYLWYSKGSYCNLVGYTDSDFSGCKSDWKSTSATCHMFLNSLVSWHSKKLVFVALSSAEEEYVAAGSCCAQILWFKQQLLDFDIKRQRIPIMCNNTSPINLTKNTVLHSCCKHIEIRYHFLHDRVEKGDAYMSMLIAKINLRISLQNLLRMNSFSAFEGNWAYLISQILPKHDLLQVLYILFL